MKNFISAGEAIRDASNPFIAFLDDGELASAGAIELSAFHDPVNNLTLVTNQKQMFSPQSGELMRAIPDATTPMPDEARRELASTCTLMQCAACKRRALVENELSFTIAHEEMACPVCGSDTQFTYVDEGETAAVFNTLADIQAHTFTGNEDVDADAYEGIEAFILGDAPMADKIAALGVMMRSMGVDDAPTEDDVNQFIAEANEFNAGGGDWGDDEEGDEVASFGQRYLSRKYELADAMQATTDDDDNGDTLEADINNLSDEENMTNNTVVGGADSVTGADDTITGGDAATVQGGEATVAGGEATVTGGDDTIVGGDATIAGGDATVAGGESTVAGGDNTVVGGNTIETMTDADLTGTYDITDGEDAITAAGGEDSVANNASVTLDDSLEDLDADPAFGSERFGDDANVSTVTVASLVDRTRPLNFAPLARDGSEIAVFVGGTHVGTLHRKASAETASALFDSSRITQAFTAVFHANRDNFETASELRAYGFRPVQLRVALDEVAQARIDAATASARAEIASRVSKAVGRHTKLINLALLGVCKDHFKVRAPLITEMASLLERSGIANAQGVVRRAFATNGPGFFAAVVEKANDLSTKSDEHLNGISEAITDKEFVGGNSPDSAPVAAAPAAAPAAPATGETASYGGRPGMGNSTTGKKDFGTLVRSISRR